MTRKIQIKQNPIRKWFIVLIIIILIFIIGFFLKPTISAWFFNAQNKFYQSGNDANSFFAKIFLTKKVFKENGSLKQKNQELTFKISQLENIKLENEELRKILDLELNKEFKFVDAYIFGKDINSDSVYINKGEKDGIKEGFAVINSDRVLLGKIIKTFQDTSLVSLITSNQLKTNVEIGENNIEAIAKGKGNLELSIENLPQEKELNTGDIVSTGRLQNEYPSGISLGTIKYVKLTDLDPFQTAIVEPYFTFNTLGLVLVITEF